MATDRRNSVENEPELSNTMIARGLTPVKDNLLVIRMDRVDTVGFKLAKGKGLREGWDSRELWKSVEKSKAEEVNPVNSQQSTVESKDA